MFFINRVIRNVGKVLAGNAVGQLITVLSVPLISRLYSPEAVGFAAVILALATIFGSFSTLRFNNAVLLPKDDLEAKQLLSLCIVVSVTLSIAISVLLTVLPDNALSYLSVSAEFHYYLWFIPLLVLLIGLNEAATAWCIRNKRFTSYSIATFSSSTVLASTKIIFGSILGGAPVFLLLGAFASNVANTLVIRWQLRDVSFNLCLTPHKLKELFFKYKDFPLYSSPTGVLNKTGKLLPILMLGFLFSPTIVGFYVMANNVIQMPLTVIGSSIRKVFQQRSAELCANNKFEELRREFVQMTGYLFKLGVFPTLILLFAAPNLLTFILGENWSVTGSYVQLLAPWFFVWFMTSPSMATLVSLRRQSFLFYYQISLIVFRILALVLGRYIFNDDFYSIALFAGVSAVGQSFLIFYTYALVSSRVEPSKLLVAKIKVCYYSPFYTSECEPRHARMHDIWHYLYRMDAPPFVCSHFSNQGKSSVADGVEFPPLRKILRRYGKSAFQHKLLQRLYNYVNAVWLLRKLKSNNCDVFHTTVLDTMSCYLIKGLRRKNAKIKVVAGPNIMSPIRQNQQFFIQLCNTPMIDQVLAVGEYHRNELVRAGVLYEKISLLPPTVDPQYFSAGTSFQLPIVPFKILFANKLSKAKGIDVFLEALEILKRETDIPFQAIIAGKGDYDVRKHVGLLEHMTLPGFVPRAKLEGYYLRAHIYVHSGADEFGPTTVIESLACGRPCLLPDLLSFSEYDVKGDCLYFIPKDARSLKEQLVLYYNQLLNGHEKEKSICGIDHSKSIEFLNTTYKEVVSEDG